MTNPRSNPSFNVVNLSLLFGFILFFSSWGFIFLFDGVDLQGYFSEKNLSYSLKFIKKLLGLTGPEPAFLQAEHWQRALELTYETLKMSVMAIGLSTIAMFLTVIPAARNVADGTLSNSKSWYNWLTFGFLRITYVFSRAVPELVWAMLIIFILKPGLLPGAIALALHNFGILGKLCAEVIEDLDMAPIRALRSSGANKAQILFYGILPMVTPKFLTFILYRWEIIIRTTIIVGFIGAGGLGQQFKLSMSWFKYTEVTLLLVCYLMLVFFADIVSGLLRRLAQ